MKFYFGILIGFIINCGLISLSSSFLKALEYEKLLWWKTILFFFTVCVGIITYLKIFAPKENGKQISHFIGASMAYSISAGIYIVYCIYSQTNLTKATILLLLGSFALQKIALVVSILRIN